jgi:feruloyl-CoA hydratase/lyase
VALASWNTVQVTLDDGIAWVVLNRPEKRNAMSPQLNSEMIEVLTALDAEDGCGVVVLTGAGAAFSAGMDLKEYFREVDGGPESVQRRVRRDSALWQWRLLRTYAKPTIAMVNGWCFGGGYGPLYACDLAIAAEEATFGLSEINWGILPGGGATKVAVELMPLRKAMFHALMGENLTGKEAAAAGLVNESLPAGKLEARVVEVAQKLLKKNPHSLKATKDSVRRVGEMTYQNAEEYLIRAQEGLNWHDKSDGRHVAMKQFLDDKTFKPGLGTYDKTKSS